MESESQPTSFSNWMPASFSNRTSSFVPQGLEEAAEARTKAASSSLSLISTASFYEPPTATPTQVKWTRAGFLVANLIVGSGIFTTPYGFKEAGWFAVVLAVLSTTVATWTGLLIGDLLESVSGPAALVSNATPPTYNTVGERAFGRAFLPFFGAFGIGQCLLQGVYMISLSAQSWQASLGFSVNKMICANAVVCLCISLIPRRYFSIIAKLGVAITLAAIAVVVASGLSLIPSGTANRHQSSFGAGFAGVSGSLSTVILSCGDHVCFPDIYTATGSQKQTYKKGIVMGFSIFLLCVLGFCIPCYFTLGDTIEPNVLTNIGMNGHGEITSFPREFRIVTNAVLAFRFLFIIPCFMPAIFAASDSFAGAILKMELSDAAGVESIFVFLREWPRKFTVCLVSRVIGYCILVCSAIFFASFLGPLVTIVGSLFQSINVIVIPCLAYNRLCPEKLQGRPAKRLLLWLLVLVGLIWCIGGTVTGVMDVIAGKST